MPLDHPGMSFLLLSPFLLTYLPGECCVSFGVVVGLDLSGSGFNHHPFLAPLLYVTWHLSAPFENGSNTPPSNPA